MADFASQSLATFASCRHPEAAGNCMHRRGAALSAETTGTGNRQMTEVASPAEIRRGRERGEAGGATRERNEREILAAAEKIFAAHGYRGAMKNAQWRKNAVRFKQLDDIAKRLSRLEKGRDG